MERRTRRYHCGLQSTAGCKHGQLVMFFSTIRVFKKKYNHQWFVPQSLSDGFFRTMGARANYNSGARFSGKVTSAVPFCKF